MTEQAPDTIASGGDSGRQPALVRAGRGSAAGSRLTALTTAVALVFAGGVVTAAWRAAGSSHGPEALIPASAFAVGTVDLSMPGGQGDALQTFADHFPDSPTHSGTGTAVDRLLRAVFGKSDRNIDYATDIKPWLGDHIALAGWLDANGKPRIEGLVQSTDDAAARAGLAKLLQGHAAVRFADGYAVLADKGSYAAQAIDAAHQSSIADQSSYTGDIDALPGTPFATGWMDAAGVRKALAAVMGARLGSMFPGMAMFGPFGLLGPGLMGAAPGNAGPGLAMGGLLPGRPGNPLSGRIAVGIRVADNYVEFDSRATGQPTAGQTDSALVKQLPSSTIAGLAIGDPGKLVASAMPALSAVMAFQALPSQLPPVPSFSSGSGFASSSGIVGIHSCVALPPPSSVPPNMPRRQVLLRRLRVLHLRAGKGCNDVIRIPAQRQYLRPPRPVDPLAGILKATGLQLPGDAMTLLGDSAVVSYGGLELNGVPKVALRTHPQDLAAATAIAHRLQGRVAKSSGLGLAVETDGADLILATTSDYAAEVKQSGALGDQAQAQTALGDVPSQVTVAGYVDLSRVLPLLASHLPADLLHLKAIGFWSSNDGGVGVSQLRIVVG